MGVFLFIIVFIFIFLDLINKIDVTNKLNAAFFEILAPHIYIIYYLLFKTSFSYYFKFTDKLFLSCSFLVFFIYVLFRISVIPVLKKHCSLLRVKVQYDGAFILNVCKNSFIFQIIVYFLEYKINKIVFFYDLYIGIFLLVLLLINGGLRFLFCSARVKPFKRAVLFFFLFIPVVNIVVIKYIIRKINEEYFHTCDIEGMKAANIISDKCATKYPIIMLHGIGFRDVKYVNYWGRIPVNLYKNGARIYYGHQEAWGTIENNAEEVKEKIYDILKENNCKKVNIIAHSKGGLDARYLISKLNMGQYIASLTCISTPNKGSEVMNLVNKLPKKIYKHLALIIDNAYRKLGDKNPDAYTSSRQLSLSYCNEFNKKVLNDGRVYYQSYTSTMKNMFSSSLLMISFVIMKSYKSGENDGLVSVKSARIGKFRRVFRSSYLKGICHADIVDSKRRDFKDFYPAEEYIKIVSELKIMGY